MADPQVLTFGQFLGKLALGTFDPNYVRKKPFREAWVVPAGAPLIVGGLVFQQSAVLGYTRANSPNALASLLQLEPNHGNAHPADAMGRMVTAWLANMKTTPAALHEVWHGAEFPEVDLTSMETLERMAKHELRLGQLMATLTMAAIFGVAYGMTFGSDLEDLWRRSFETPMDVGKRIGAKSMFNSMPEQHIYPLAEAQRAALDQAALYARAFRPDLLESLDLTSYGLD